MPIYEFVCISCGSDFEELVVSASDQSKVQCPTCASSDVKKKISIFASKAPGSRSTSFWGGSPGSSCGSGSI